MLDFIKMKRLLIILLLLYKIGFGQQNISLSLFSDYAILEDTTKQTITVSTPTYGHSNRSYFKINQVNPSNRLLDNYDGLYFVFNDTLVTGDLVQQGSIGLWKITLHANPINTTKRNILAFGYLFQFDNASQTLITPTIYGDPLKIKDNASGTIILTLNANGTATGNLPGNWSLFGSTLLRKVIIQK